MSKRKESRDRPDKEKRRRDTDAFFSETELNSSVDSSGLDPMEEWKPIKLEPDFTDVPEEEGSDPSWCFECDYGQSKAQAEEQTSLVDIRTYVAQNYHRVDAKALCREVQRMYNSDARMFVEGEPAWHCAQIYKHYHVDAPTQVVEMEQMLSDVKQLYNVTRNSMILYNPGSDQYQIDDKHFDRFMKLRRAKREDMKAVLELRNHDVH